MSYFNPALNPSDVNGRSVTIRVIGWLVVLTSGLDLLGWWLGVPSLTSVIPNYATMKPNTALCLGLLGLVITLRERPQRKDWSKWSVRLSDGLSAAVLLLSLLTGIEYAAGRNLKIDQLLASVPIDRFGNPAGRMSLGTSICLALTALAFLLIDWQPKVSTLLLLLGMGFSFSGLVGFVLQAGPLTGVPLFSSLAIHTALGLLLLQCAAFESRPDREPYRSLVEYWRRVGQRRNLLLAVIGLPVLLAIPVVAGMKAHLYDAPFAMALLVVLLFGLQTLILWIDNRALSKAEERLRQSDDKLRLALEAAQLGPWELNPETWEMHCSIPCKANYGRGPDAPFGYEDLLTSIVPEDLEDMKAAAATAIETGMPYKAEYRVAWPDNSIHWIIASGRVIEGRDGVAVMLGVTLDVTERHLAAQALLHSEKLAVVGRLASSIAHEINNPLAAMTNLLFLAGITENVDEMKPLISQAEHELKRVSLIANQTLQFHKQMALPQPAWPKEVIDSTLLIYQGKLAKLPITISRRDRVTNPVVCYDGEIRQVLSNLVGNAVEAMALSGGQLSLRSRDATDWKTGGSGVSITVADTGSGISAETLSRLFEPFFTTKGVSGTGLGLWISNEITKRHGGSIRVRSKAQSEPSGTVFTLFLPSIAAIR